MYALPFLVAATNLATAIFVSIYQAFELARYSFSPYITTAFILGSS